MRILRSVLLCAIVAGSALFLTAAPIGASSTPASGPGGTVIHVTVPSCPSGIPMATLVDVVVLDTQSGVSGSGMVSVTVPLDAFVGHTLVVYSGCNNIDNPQTSFLVTAGNSGTVTTPGGTVTIDTPADTVVSDIASSAIPAGAPAGVSFPYGLVGFSVAAPGTGWTIQVVVTFPAPVNQYWKYQGGAWSLFPGATFSGNTAIVTLTDGGAGDADGAANGVVVDPGAGGVTAAAALTPMAAAVPTALVATPSLTG